MFRLPCHDVHTVAQPCLLKLNPHLTGPARELYSNSVTFSCRRRGREKSSDPLARQSCVSQELFPKEQYSEQPESERMLQKRVVLVSAAVAVLGLAVAVLGFAAEATRSKALVGIVGQRCVYRRTPALVCGIVAALLVLTGMAIVTAASGCFGRYGEHASAPGGRRRSAAFRLSTIAWVLVVVATVMFLYGASRNAGGTRGLWTSRSGRRSGRVYYTSCPVLKGGVFATASILSAVANACAIAAYVNLQRVDEPAPGQFAGPPGIVMGHPQWGQPQPPPPAYPPVGYPAPPPYGYGGYGAKQPGTA